MPKTLLLADDSVTIQKVVGISFASQDVKLITVDNGDDALARAREIRPDVILADVVMPGLNGYELCEAVKGDAALTHIPVLLLTGTFEAFDEERARRAGASGHVAKPFEAQTLVEQVNRLLSQAPAAPSASAAPRPAGSATAVDAPTQPEVPVTGPDDGDAEAFDFFDEELGDLAGGNTDSGVRTPGSLEIDEPDSAFSFGEPEPVREEIPLPAQRPEATVAILPDEEPDPRAVTPATRPPEELLDPEPLLSAELEDPETPGEHPLEELEPLRDDDEIEAPTRTPLLARADTPSEDDLAFAFDAEPARPAAEVDDGAWDSPSLGQRAGGPVRVEADDLAQAAVLDPNGASGYDVSSSDLGEPVAVPPAVEEARPPIGRERPPARVEQPGDARVEQPGDGMGEPMAELVDDAPAPVARPRPEPPPARAVEPPSAAALLDRIGPSLRSQIHDTLEKAAWDAFGGAAEKIVSETVERVEKIAWEVIPQIAETLIREEIRRLKGE